MTQRLVIQPQLPLGRVVLAIMDDAGALLQAHVTFDTPEGLDAALIALEGARVAVFGEGNGEPSGAAYDRTWACKVGDDCRCWLELTADPPHIPQCAHFGGFNAT